MQVFGRIKALNFFTNWFRGLPLQSEYLPKSGIFDFFCKRVYLWRAPIGVKFRAAKRTHVPLGRVKFHVYRCNGSPHVAKMLIFGLWVKTIPAVWWKFDRQTDESAEK